MNSLFLHSVVMKTFCKVINEPPETYYNELFNDNEIIGFDLFQILNDLGIDTQYAFGKSDSPFNSPEDEENLRKVRESIHMPNLNKVLADIGIGKIVK
jgi:hypothetical protein